MQEFKNYLTYENGRNQTNHRLYERLIKRALGPDTEVLVVHHITFMVPGKQPNEIPAADTFMFDHDMMKAIFGDGAQGIMVKLAMTPCHLREQVLAEYLDKVEATENAA